MPGGTHVALLSNGQKLQVSRLQSRIIRERFLRLYETRQLAGLDRVHSLENDGAAVARRGLLPAWDSRRERRGRRIASAQDLPRLAPARCRQIRLRGNGSAELWLFVAWVAFLLLVVLPWMIRRRLTRHSSVPRRTTMPTEK